jgi:amino acid transporter
LLQICGVTAALFILHFFVSIVNTPWLGLLSTIGAWFQILSIVVICITLLAISPKYQSAKFVFTHFVKAPGNGIGSGLLVVLLGLPYAQSILTGFEVGSHVVEEVKTAAMAGPRAMIRSVYVTASTEFVLLLVLTFCIQNPDNVLGDNTMTGTAHPCSFYWIKTQKISELLKLLPRFQETTYL